MLKNLLWIESLRGSEDLPENAIRNFLSVSGRNVGVAQRSPNVFVAESLHYVEGARAVLC